MGLGILPLTSGVVNLIDGDVVWPVVIRGFESAGPGLPPGFPTDWE